MRVVLVLTDPSLLEFSTFFNGLGAGPRGLLRWESRVNGEHEQRT